MPLLDRLTERDIAARADAKQARRTPYRELGQAFLIAAVVLIIGWPLLVLIFCLGAGWVRP